MTVKDGGRPLTRFATVEDVFSPEFKALNEALNELHVKHNLPDHADVNEERYPWSRGLLGSPAFYAARLWEYAYSILVAELEPGMKVADIGCGMTAFTIYLKDRAGCDVTGVDPDVFESGVKNKGHGVSQEFIKATGLRFVEGEMTDIPLETDSQDRVYCISVMEHVPSDVRLRGMREIARILRPGGRAILTVDMSMTFTLNRPLDMIWDSGLQIDGPADMRWPARRFGMFTSAGSSGRPADVFGMVLTKDASPVDTEYRRDGETVQTIPQYRVPTLIPVPTPVTFAQRVRRRLAREAGKGAGK